MPMLVLMLGMPVIVPAAAVAFVMVVRLLCRSFRRFRLIVMAAPFMVFMLTLVVMMLFLVLVISVPAAAAACPVFMIMPLGLVLIVGMGCPGVNPEANPLPVRTIEMEMKIAEIELGEFPLQRRWLHPEIAQSPKQFSTGEPCKTVKKEDTHKD